MLQLEKNPHSNKCPTQPKINLLFFFKKKAYRGDGRNGSAGKLVIHMGNDQISNYVEDTGSKILHFLEKSNYKFGKEEN